MTAVREVAEDSGRIASSFRDPSGYVFRHDQRIFRAVDADCWQTLTRLESSGLCGHFVKKRAVVGTRFIDDREETDCLARQHPGYEHFLEHEVIWPITYPYEWTASMLADAALLTLDLQAQLLPHGYSLKDASAYNVQWVDGRPLFIDMASIENATQPDVWYALGQFQRMFTFPLYLWRYHGWDLRSYFLSRLDGRNLEEMVRSLGFWERWHPRLLLDVTLPLLLGRKVNGQRGGPIMAPTRGSGPSMQGQLWNLRRLRRQIARLAAGYRPGGTWTGYTTESRHSDVYRQAKHDRVDRFLTETRPACVLDAGCNTGDFSFLAARRGAQVIAIDGDHDAVELLYRRLRSNPQPITPLVIDLANPSPAIGNFNRERPSFLDRVQADCVIALALVHHLLVSANLSLSAVAQLLGRLTRRHLVLEFVPPHDPLFRTLLRGRRETYAHIDLAMCRQAFAAEFELTSEFALPDSPRTLLTFRKHGS